MPPTKEQLAGLLGHLRDLCCHPSSTGCTCSYEETASAVWDYVLEEAAKVLDARRLHDASLDDSLVADVVAELRAMKGEP